jgi:phosphoglycolate phosphatase
VTCERSFFGKHIGLRRVLESRALRPSEAIYVADEIRDIDACRKIDLRVISVGWGFDLAVRLGSANPGMLAHAPGDILDLLSNRAVCRIEVEPVTALAPAAVGLAS